MANRTLSTDKTRKDFYGGLIPILLNTDDETSEGDWFDFGVDESIEGIEETIEGASIRRNLSYFQGGILYDGLIRQAYDRFQKNSLADFLIPSVKAVKFTAQIPVEYNNTVILSLPEELIELSNEIDRSKYILQLEENWDDEGASAYKIETWIKAIEFLGKYATQVYQTYNKVVPIPTISHGPKGSIDFLWKTENYHLLMNVDKSHEGSYYGYSKATKHEVESTFDLDNMKLDLFPLLLF